MDKLLELQQQLTDAGVIGKYTTKSDYELGTVLKIIVDELVQQRQTIEENGPAEHRD